jgi:glycosyltransferase involved in cell wall biosynthesis
MSNGISIIIPTFGTPEFIDECIESIQKQNTKLKFEILIGIDKCEDTLNHIKNNKELYSKTKVFYFNENVGPYVIKNNLVRETVYDKLLFFDSDDVMNDNLLETIHPILIERDVVRFKLQNFTVRDNVKRMLSTETSVGVFGIKKHRFELVNGFESWRCHSDSEFKRRVNFLGFWTMECDNILFKRRIHGKNLTVKEDTNMISDLRKKYMKESSSKPKGKNPETLKIDYDIVLFE